MRFVAPCLLVLFAAASGVIPAHAVQGSKGTLTGKVVDGRGKGIVNARVTAKGASDADATTNDKGEFRIELEPGEYRLTFEAEGHATAALREGVEVTAGKETKLPRKVTLPDQDESSVVRGSVFAESGLAIPGARVTIERVQGDGADGSDSLKRDTTSDSMGLYAFRLPKGGGRYKLTATHERYATATVTVDVAGGEILNAPPLTMGGGRP